MQNYEIYIEARLWFQKSYGNTYHTAKVDIYDKSSKQWTTLVSPMTYGYGEHYKHTAASLLLENGYFNNFDDAYKLARHFSEMKGSVFFTELEGLKRDLHKQQ